MARDMSESPRVIRPRPLTPEAFAPYGEVIAHQGAERRHYLTEPMRHGPEVVRHAGWVSRVQAAPPGRSKSG